MQAGFRELRLRQPADHAELILKVHSCAENAPGASHQQAGPIGRRAGGTVVPTGLARWKSDVSRADAQNTDNASILDDTFVSSSCINRWARSVAHMLVRTVRSLVHRRDRRICGSATY
jgi:hypothetical protein